MSRRRVSWALSVIVSLGCQGGGGRESASEAATAATTADTTSTAAGSSGTSEGAPTSGEASTGATSTSGGVKFDAGGDPDFGPPDSTGECAAQTLEPEITSVGVDIIVIVDTSFSMAAAIDAVEASLNVDFAAVLAAANIDYRIIVMGDWPPGGQLDICITAPLSATDCNPAPAVPAVTELYKHYDAATGSGAFLQNIVAWYSTPDPHGLAPGGYKDFLREGTRKVFLGMTDATSASDDPLDGEAFDAAVLGLQPPHFGTPGDRKYVFHAIIEMAPNDPADAPWLPADPIQGYGGSIQHVSVLSGGWRFPLSQTADFDVLFKEIAQEVVQSTPIACEFPIPDPMMGMIDPNTIEIDYYVGGVGPAEAFHQVVGPDNCELDAFYIADGVVHLCPEACAAVQADAMAKLDVRYGCDVGFDPNG